MPIYEYKCLNCGKISEYFINKNLEEEIIMCKYCGSKNVKKLFSSVTVLNSETLTNRRKGKTCCGREERCSIPPCTKTGTCRKNEN